MTPPRKVLLTGPCYGPGGRENHLLHVARALRDRGHEVTLALRIADPSTPLLDAAPDLGIDVLGTPFMEDPSRVKLSTAWAVATWPLRLRPHAHDAILAIEATGFLRFLSLFLNRDGRTVWTRAGHPPFPEPRSEAPLPFTPDQVVVEHPDQFEAIQAAIGLDAPLHALPHAGHWRDPPRAEPASGCDRVAFLGRVGRAKGVFDLLDAWEALDPDDVELAFHGVGPDRNRLQDEGESRGLEDVRFHGGWAGQEELEEILAGTDLVVLPSHREGLPLTLVEAAAHGVPFLATDTGLVPALGEDNPDAEIVPVGPEPLRRGLETMIRRVDAGDVDPKRLQAWHRERFDYDELLDDWCSVLLEEDPGTRDWTART